MKAPEPLSGARKQDIFRLALKRKTPLERAAFLDDLCGDDPAVRAELETLLAGEEQNQGTAVLNADAAGVRVEQGATEVMPTLLGQTTVSEGPGTVIGRYKLLEKVGEGGFGVVYVAEQKEPVKRRVALKIIKLGMDTKQVVARFEAERQALAMMDHPNIAKVLDAGATDTGRPFFVMELVKGIPITKYCDQEKLATRERLDLFIKVCHAIQHAHQKGIIHRDIKPSNILVTLHDGVPVPKVIDFGIAKATQQELTEKTVYTQLQQFIGTPAYMSPEQAEMSGLDIDTRSDIYSLGVLLYELLTGNTPFDTKELMESGLDEMRRIIREQEPVRPSTRLTQELAAREKQTGESRRQKAEIEVDLDWIVMKCLEKDRTRRYETANGLAMDLQRHLNQEPVVARPPSVGYRLQKSFRRNKLVFIAAGAVALALVLGVVVSSWQAIRATKARRAEAEARLRSDQNARIADNERARAEKGEQRAQASERAAHQQAYEADMLLAHHARDDGNLDLALDLLDKRRPRPGEADLRGWEWRYLWGVCQSDELRTIATNPSVVWRVAMSPDGSLLSAAGIGGLGTGASIWRFPSGQLFATPETDDTVGSVAFSPDGKLLAFGTENHGLKLWDVATGKETAEFPGRYEQKFFSALVFSPDGRTLAASAAESEILLWDIETKKPRSLKGHSAGISSLVFTPDGTTLFSGSWDGTIRMWSSRDGQEIARFTSHGVHVHAVALSADGKTLVSDGGDNAIRIWNVAARRQLGVLTNHIGFVSSLAFSPDGRTLALKQAC